MPSQTHPGMGLQMAKSELPVYEANTPLRGPDAQHAEQTRAEMVSSSPLATWLTTTLFTLCHPMTQYNHIHHHALLAHHWPAALDLLRLVVGTQQQMAAWLLAAAVALTWQDCTAAEAFPGARRYCDCMHKQMLLTCCKADSLQRTQSASSYKW